MRLVTLTSSYINISYLLLTLNFRFEFAIGRYALFETMNVAEVTMKLQLVFSSHSRLTYRPFRIVRFQEIKPDFLDQGELQVASRRILTSF